MPCARGEAPGVIEGKVSSTLQVTIPARVRDALGIEPGDAPRFELEAGSVRLRVVRPAIEDSLEAVWAKHDLGDLREAMGATREPMDPSSRCLWGAPS